MALAQVDRDMASHAWIQCIWCVFRHVNGWAMLPPMKTTVAGPDVGEKVYQAPSLPWALTGLCLSMLLSSLGTSIANVGLPTLSQAFAATFQEVQWVVLAYLLAVTSLIVSIGRLGDLIGRRRLLLAGIFLFTIASVLCGFAPTLWLLIAARGLQGLGAAAMMALTMAFVRWPSSARRFRRRKLAASWDC
jgi:MFS family permease